MPTANITILYAEDEEGDRFFMERAFELAGLASALQTVANGDAAIQYLSGTGIYADRIRHPIPQLMLLDLNMPKVSGFEVLEWVRKHPTYSTLPVIIFSGSSRKEDRARATALGANEYWEKPSSGLRYPTVVSALREKWLEPAAGAPALHPPISPQAEASA